MASCRAVAVLANGTDGCGRPVAVLKAHGGLPSNTGMGPTTYVLQNVDPAVLVRLPPCAACTQPATGARWLQRAASVVASLAARPHMHTSAAFL